jgi:hypothetical protein
MNTDVDRKVEDKEREYVDNVRAEFEAFRKRKGYQDVELDTVTTLDAVRKFRGSMKGYKASHEGRDADRFQQVAYYVSWLVKVKPAYLCHGNLPLEEIDARYDKYYESGYNTINEHFAFGAALNMLEIKPGEVDNETQGSFVEMLYHGNLDPIALALTLRMMFGTIEAKRVEMRSRLLGRIFGGHPKP